MLDATRRPSARKRLVCLALAATLAESTVAHAQRPVAPGNRSTTPTAAERTDPAGKSRRGAVRRLRGTTRRRPRRSASGTTCRARTRPTRRASRFRLAITSGKATGSFRARSPWAHASRPFASSRTATRRPTAANGCFEPAHHAPIFPRALRPGRLRDGVFAARPRRGPSDLEGREEQRHYSGWARAVIALQNLPLLGEDSKLLPSFGLTGIAGYDHAFRRTTTPTNPELERVRMGLDGETLPSAELTGRAFIDDEVLLGFSTTLMLHERVRWSNLFEWHLAWRYRFRERRRGGARHGAGAGRAAGKSRKFRSRHALRERNRRCDCSRMLARIRLPESRFPARPRRERRSPFYSPDARFSLSLVGHLDAVSPTASPVSRRASVASAERAPGGSH